MGIVLLLYLYGRGRPWLVVGLLWYLGTFVPVIGLVQVGKQLMADRYTYLPSIGLFIIIAWGAEEIFTKKYFPKAIPTIGAAAAIIVMAMLTRIQTSYWQDSEKLFTHALAVTKNNYVMHDAYGLYLYEERRYDEAIRHFQEAIHIAPGYFPARMNLYQSFMMLNRVDEAINCYTEALQIGNGWPQLYKFYEGLGWAYEQKNDIPLAEKNYRKALELKPDYTPAQNGLISVLAKQGKKAETVNPKF
jgi:tetratricopeptide (TPR) repeat protein